MNRSLKTLTLLLYLVCFTPASGNEDETLDWLSSYKEALEQAKRTGQPIFLEYRCEP
jgi:hypothetical protein